MSDHVTGPKRLLDGGSDFERSLLESARDEAPPPELEGRVLAALVAAPLVAPPTPAPAAPPAPSATPPSPRAPLGLTGPRGLAMLAAVVGLGAVIAVSAGRDPAPSTSAPVVTTTAMTAAPAAPAPEQPAENATLAPVAPIVTVTPDSLPTAPAATTSPIAPVNPPATAKTAAAEGGTSIEREIELLDGVKAKLGQNDAAGAAKALDGYDREFPAGVLAPERTVLRIRTLILQGNRPAAARMGEEFLAKHPGSVHAKRIRALLAD